MFPFAVNGAVCRRRNLMIPLLFTTSDAINNPSLLLNSTYSLLLLLGRSLHVIKPINNSSSLTVSYLMNSCGLSRKSALSAAKWVSIKTTSKPNSNLAALKSHGFSDSQITRLISMCPQLLLSNWEKSIKPKFDYLLSVGYSETYLPTLVSSNPDILRASLQRRLKHNIDLLSPIFGTQQLAASVRKSSAWLLTVKLETNFLPNVRILQSYGIPAPNIAKLAAGNHRNMIVTTAANFKTTVELLRKMGFNPLSTMFIQGIRAATSMNPSIWERKVAFFKSMGWSEADFVSAFRKQPMLPALSEEKIRRRMDFFASRLQWEPSFIATYPVLLCLSLEKRVIPRCLVMSVLASNGLVRSYPGTSYQFLLMPDKIFTSKYVTKYQDQVPDVIAAYKGDSEFAVFDEGGSRIA